MTLAFYLFLLSPYISDIVYTPDQLTINCIYIILGALLLNGIFAILLGVNKLYRWIKTKRAAETKLDSPNNEATKVEKFPQIFEKV